MYVILTNVHKILIFIGKIVDTKFLIMKISRSTVIKITLHVPRTTPSVFQPSQLSLKVSVGPVKDVA